MADAATSVPRHFDECACWKPEGCWGTGGWHLGEWTKDSFIRYSLDRAASRLRVERLTPEQHAEAIRRAELEFPLYAGAVYAYESCPAYRAAAQRAQLAAEGKAPPAGPEPPSVDDKSGGWRR